MKNDNSLISHYYLLGLQTQNLIEYLETHNNNLDNIHECVFNPEIIDRLCSTNITQTDIIEDEYLLKLCFPNKYRIVRNNSYNIEPEVFSFSVENSKSVNERIYFSCMIIYENIENLIDISNFTQKDNIIEYSPVLQDTNYFHKESESSSETNQSLLKRKTGLFVGSGESDGDFILVNNKSPTPKSKNSMITAFKDRSKTELNLEYINVDSESYKLKERETMSKSELFCPKIIVFSSESMFYKDFDILIKDLYYRIIKKPSCVSYDQCIHYLLNSIPSAPNGLYTIEFVFLDKTYKFQNTLINDTPEVNQDIDIIFRSYTSSEFLEIYKWVLLEYNVLIFSSKISLVTTFTEAFRSLLYPFKYSKPYHSILPTSYFGLLNKLNGCLIGINSAYTDDFFSKNEINTEHFNKHTLIVNIDKSKIIQILTRTPRKFVSLQNLNKIPVSQKKEASIEIPDFPNHYKSKMSSRLKEFVKKCNSSFRTSVIKALPKQKLLSDYTNFLKEIKKKINHEIDHHFPAIAKSSLIKLYFTYFNTSLIKNYNKYVINTNMQYKRIEMNINYFFSASEFISNSNMTYGSLSFYEELVNSTHFLFFIKNKHYLNKNSNLLSDYILFEELILLKTSKNILSFNSETPFTDSKAFNFTETYQVKDMQDTYQLNFKANEKELLNVTNIPNYFVKTIIKNGGDEAEVNPGSEIEKRYIGKYYYSYVPVINDMLLFQTEAVKLDNLKNKLRSKFDEFLAKKDNISKLTLQDREELKANSDVYIVSSYMVILTDLISSTDNNELKNVLFSLVISYLDKVKEDLIPNITDMIFHAIYTYCSVEMLIKLYNMYHRYNMLKSVHGPLLIEKLGNYKELRGKLITNVKEKMHVKSIVGFPNNSISDADASKLPKRMFGIIDKTNNYDLSERLSSFLVEDKTLKTDKNEEICIFTNTVCIECQSNLDIFKLCKNPESTMQIVWTNCYKCKKSILPKIAILIKNKFKNEFSSETVPIYSPYFLYSTLYKDFLYKNNLKCLSTFRKSYSTIFWNCIWYFKLLDLPYFIIVPEVLNTEELEKEQPKIFDNLIFTNRESIFKGAANKETDRQKNKASSKDQNAYRISNINFEINQTK